MHSFGTNSFYFLCAPYFYNKIDELGLFEFNPYFVAKKIILNKNNEIEIIKISEYRLVYESNHPLAQENGIECGYVRYYSSDIKTDKYWLDFYLKIRSLFKER